jgi:exodeoxyribonuclease VII small subunit
MGEQRRDQMSDDVEKLSFEQAFGELEDIVRRMEAGDLTLDQAIALYERGMRLAQHCGDALDTAELQIRQLALVEGSTNADALNSIQ